MNILVVDDETVMVDSLRIGLEGRGYQVFECNSVTQALRRLNHGDHKIDMVVTDYLMPTLNGLDLLGAIRERHPTLPVIIMTAYAETSLVIAALRNHCNSFIEKPFTLDQLVAEIEKVNLYILRNTKSSDLQRVLPRLVHQINNPLTAISGYAQLISRSLGNGEALQKCSESIMDAVGQISLINKDIMNAGRDEENTLDSVELNALLAGCLEMFQGLFILKGVQVQKKLSEPGLSIQGNRFGLEQVFKNLLLNAIDAMDDRIEKKLSITTTPLPDTAAVEVAIEDTGCGIGQDIVARIFEPYFTAKRNGNGLGLEIVKSVVEKHGGKVFVESMVGIGSKFTVRLPAMQTTEPYMGSGLEVDKSPR